MGKKSAPPAPDYTKAAEATSQSNQEAQTRADWANRPTINTPWGQQSWQATAGIDPATGQRVTNWTQNTQVNPLAQSTLDATMQVDRDKALLAQSMMGRAADATAQPSIGTTSRGTASRCKLAGCRPSRSAAQARASRRAWAARQRAWWCRWPACAAPWRSPGWR